MARSSSVSFSTGKKQDVENNKLPLSSNSATKVGVMNKSIHDGYHFPPKHNLIESLKIHTREFGKFITTPFGFLITIYGLNIVAWGGMLFLLLCNATPAMCRPTCDDINSSRRIWIEIDSQILNALFCVTGFGTIPWRFRDLWYLMQYRILKKEIGLSRLADTNKRWFRLPSSMDITSQSKPNYNEPAANSVNKISGPLPKASIQPLTGVRAPPTKLWKLDLVIWAMVLNTFLQAALSGLMWGMNRFNRPSWSTGLLITLGCLVAGLGGLVIFLEGKKVKAIEGIPISQQDLAKLSRDREAGILHWNNIKDKKPNEPKEKKIAINF